MRTLETIIRQELAEALEERGPVRPYNDTDKEAVHHWVRKTGPVPSRFKHAPEIVYKYSGRDLPTRTPKGVGVRRLVA